MTTGSLDFNLAVILKWKILLIIFWGSLVSNTENYIQLTYLEDNSM